MTYQSKLYAEHGLKPGRQVIRLSWTRKNGTPVEDLYLYDTASYHTEDRLKQLGITFTRERIPWDGKGYVSTDNGD
jgi:hypothetical protein